MTTADNHAPDSRLVGAQWLTAQETQSVLAAITSGGGDARVVGGAIRNTLLGHPVTDIDIATTVHPDEVLARVKTAGMSAIPTGLAHGTITVIANHKPFEVTTLRRDVETHGRHATVAFTEDWSTDAHRRDFTINAIYSDASGRLFDPTGGIIDLAANRVRFIGSAQDRIEEDYLRILRFYRFTAHYGAGRIDREGHEACAALQEGLESISAERVNAELFKLLIAPHAAITLSEMDEAGLLSRVLGVPADVVSFARLAAIEAGCGLAPDPVRRLYALAVLKPGDAAHLRDRLRLSKAHYERLADLTLPESAVVPSPDEHRARCYLYRHGPIAFRDGVLVTWARDMSADFASTAHHHQLALADRWIPPTLPVSGKDVIALGVPPGPEIGHILDLLEHWWMTAGFPESEILVRNRLKALINLKNA